MSLTKKKKTTRKATTNRPRSISNARISQILKLRGLSAILDVLTPLVGAGSVDGLGDILSALRGPDLPDPQNVKDQTTAKIRAAAFKGNYPGNNNSDRVITPYAMALADGLSDHFGQHINSAKRTLIRLGRLKAA